MSIGSMKLETAGNPRSRQTFGFASFILLFGFGFPINAQQTTSIPTIGYISGSDARASSGQVEGFREGLRNLRYHEGKNIVVQYRYAEGKVDRIPVIVAELIKLPVDILVSTNAAAISNAKQATKTVPIVMITTIDPVAGGLIDSLAHPGGNITGVTRLAYELSDKRLEILKQAVPTISRVAILLATGRTRGADLKEYEAAAQALKIALLALLVRGPDPDLQGAFQSAVKERVNALITGRGPVLNNYRRQIADLAIKNRLPLMSEGSQYVDAGALMSYATSDAESSKRAATYVDKILKGTKPADLPVEQPTKFELAINLRTAKQIGVTIPPNVLARADRVIK